MINSWVIPKGFNVPDFIICGAMKSGTSTLHKILNKHPDIYIPDNEIHFFNIDDIIQHPDFNYFDGKNWFAQDFDKDPEKFFLWYSSQFKFAKPNQIIGEDSTTYIASGIVAERIKIQNKTIKLIITLRNPTDRTYSHYWHLLRSGWATHSFENTLRYAPDSIINRSLYLGQIKNFLNHIPRKQMKIIIFEHLLKKRDETLNDICDFINVDYKRISEESKNIHENKAKIPKYLDVQKQKNRYFRESGNMQYYSSLPVNVPLTIKKKPILYRLTNKIYKFINPIVDLKPPDMKASTRKYLDDFFKRELNGINEILGIDALGLWFN